MISRAAVVATAVATALPSTSTPEALARPRGTGAASAGGKASGCSVTEAVGGASLAARRS